MKISERGINLIKSFEGCKLVAYKCPAGVWTIGYGHTSGVISGMKITQAQADSFLKSDLERYESYVNNKKLSLNQNQFDALVSFTYNCGNGNLTKLVKDRTLAEIADALLLYNKSNGKVLAGLTRRREAERTLFLESVVSNAEPDMGVGLMRYDVKAYSKAKLGDSNVSKNFKVKEFACKDGSDPVFISKELVDVLQKIRSHFGKPVNINSAYRTATYNKKVGGATYSQHLYGTAADIVVTGVEPKKVAAYAETLMPNSGGIGIYSNFTHIDVRVKKSRWNG